MFQFIAVAVLATVVTTATTAQVGFSGVWILNKAESKGLSPVTAEAEKVTWTIVQDANTIAVTESVAGPRPGGGTLGTYRLDGVETTEQASETLTVALQAKRTGEQLVLLRKQIIAGSTPMETHASRTFELSKDGRTLTVVGHFESPRGKSDSTMVFKKQ